MKKGFAWLMGLLVIAMASQAAAGTWTTNQFFYKPSLGARGENEKALYDSGLDQVDTRLGKEIWLGDPNYGNTLPSAITAIGSSNVTLRVPAGTYPLSAALTVPANITLQLECGAVIALGNYNLTVNGPFKAGLYQVFSCTGSGVVAFGGLCSTAYPEWWGTNGLQAAINASGIFKVQLTQPLYTIASGLTIPNVPGKAGLEIVGVGDPPPPENTGGTPSIFAAPVTIQASASMDKMIYAAFPSINPVLSKVRLDGNSLANYGL